MLHYNKLYIYQIIKTFFMTRKKTAKISYKAQISNTTLKKNYEPTTTILKNCPICKHDLFDRAEGEYCPSCGTSEAIMLEEYFNGGNYGQNI